MMRTTWCAELFLFIGVPLWCCSFVIPCQAQKVGAFQKEFDTAVSDYDSGQFAKAASELETLARELPSSFQVQELLGLVYSEESNNQEAYRHFRRAVQLKPDSAAARANLAVNLSSLGKKELAEAEFKRALQIEPANYETNKDFAEFYLRAGKMTEAVPYFEKAQTIHPSYENGYNLALAYELTGRPKDAKREIQELLKTKDAAELHNLLGEVDEKLADYIAAANEYQQAARMDPTESNLFDWGTELLAHHTLDPAIDVFDQGLKRFPDSPRLRVGLGLAYYWRGSYDDAVKALLRAIDLSPADPGAYYFLSKAYDRSPSQAVEVIDRFRRFAELKPHDAKAKFYYAMSLWKGNQTAISERVLDQVEALLEKATLLDPALTEAHFELGNLYSQQQKFAEAVPQYTYVIKRSPNDASAHYRLGQAYVHLGRRNLAQKEFQAHQRLYSRQLAEDNKERTEIQEFIYSLKSGPAQPED